VATAVAYPTAVAAGARPNVNAQPGPTAAPFIIEGPAALISAPMELWFGASGGPQWGGCNIWISTDGVNYVQALLPNGSPAQCVGPAAFGTMQPSGLTSGGTTATVTIGTTRQMVSISAADFAARTYPCIIYDGSPEWMAYETAALVTGSEYNLTTLARGLYGTAAATHANTALFAMIDSAFAKVPYPNGVNGATLFVKLPAFNLYGAQLEDLSTVTAYNYTIGGYPIPSAGPALIVELSQSSTSANQVVFTVTVHDPANLLTTCTVTPSQLGLSLLRDLSTGLAAAPYTATVGTPRGFQLILNSSYQGEGSAKFVATAPGRTQ
ncbi:MAG TPA: hypothetical protein VGH04_14245, partial [Gemmatimonadaceae bacterium]